MDGFGTLDDFLRGPALGLFLLGIIVLAGLSTLFFSGIVRHRRMLSERKGEDIDSFVLHLASYGFDPVLAREIYTYLTTEEDVAFPIRHTDRFDEDLRVSEEEVHRLITHLLRCSRREALPGMRHMPLVTVEDALRFVQSCPIVEMERRFDPTISSVRRAVAS